MRIVDIDEGIVSLRWPWLPFWVATHPTIQKELEGEMTAWIKETGLQGKESSEEILDQIHDEVCRRIEVKIGFSGIGKYVDGIRQLG